MKVLTLENVKNFILTLDSDTQSFTQRDLRRLEDYGYRLSMPHSKKIDSNLYELRILGRQSVRMLYTFRNNRIFVVHCFIKKQDKIPPRELHLAQKYINLLREYNL